jgi:excisionase family DNA binding protein
MNTPLAYNLSEACEVARISRTSIYQAINSRELVARKHGRRTVILADDLGRWLQSLPVAAPKARPLSQADRPADVVAA